MKSVQRLDFIRSRCAGKKVLHLGCANYPYTQDSIDKKMLLHFELERIASGLYGFDFDQPGLDILAANGSKNLYRADLEKLDEVELNTTFDVIVAGEMIEHLYNPGLFLRGIQRFMAPDSALLLTTINAFCGMRFIQYGLRGKGGKQEPVHPDHVAYYSYATLTVLLGRHGLKVDEFLFYDIGVEHRPHNRWFLNLMNDVCVRIAPQWSDGVIAVCSIQR
ncbi:MAG: methyltransferase domain-containing protein [Chloracidobacterium sp.]|nr:methyltransferase domain-containing protein [Chloracidobacterium sp.]